MLSKSSLISKMNGRDVGDINHSRMFAHKLDNAIYDELESKLKEEIGRKLKAI